MVKIYYLRSGVFNLMCIDHNINKIYSFLSKNSIDIAVAMNDIGKIEGFGGNMEKNSRVNSQVFSIAR